jgi:amino acid permease
MKFARNTFTLICMIMLMLSCGPGYKVGDKKIKKIRNIHDVTLIKKSKFNYEKVKERRAEQSKRNKERWEKQMKNRYKN